MCQVRSHAVKSNRLELGGPVSGGLQREGNQCDSLRRDGVVTPRSVASSKALQANELHGALDKTEAKVS